MDYPDKDDPDVIDAEFEVIVPGASENIGNGREKGSQRAANSTSVVGGAVEGAAEFLFPKRSPRPKPRYRIPLFVVSVTALFVIAGLSQISRNAAPPSTKTATNTAPVPPPTADPPRSVEPAVPQPSPAPAAAPVPPPPTPAPAPLPTAAAPNPPPAKPAAEPKPAAPEQAAPPTAAPSPDEEMVRKTIAAMKAGQDAERLAREKQAIQRDKEELASAQAIVNREKYTGDIAGMGYTVKENQSISVGRSLGPTATATVAECALSCLSKDCDGFAFFGAHPPSQISNLKPCYRYKKPLTFFPSSGYISGERTADLAALSQAPPATAAGPTISTDTERVAQTGSQPSSSSLPSDGLTRCANGPVKVTGFSLTCDKLLTGGRTLGSTQLAYTVNDINDCAAKCRPVQACTGFTFNSAEPPGRRSCQIFGGQTGMNNGSGWISGTR